MMKNFIFKTVTFHQLTISATSFALYFGQYETILAKLPKKQQPEFKKIALIAFFDNTARFVR